MKYRKITILTSEFPPQPGGIGNHALNLAEELSSNGFSVQVLCDRRSVEGREEETFDAELKFEVIRIPRRTFILFSYFHRIIKAFKLAESTEVVISSGKFPLWLGGLLSLFFQNKYIAVIHGSELFSPNQFLRKLTSLSLKRFNVVVAVSNYTRSLLGNFEVNNIEVIHNGFSINCNTEQERFFPSPPVLITVGNVNRRKGQQNVIHSLPTLLKKYPGLQYHIVGIPTEREYLLELAKQLKVEKSITFHGAVDEIEKCKLLLSSNIFIMLSESTKSGDVEGFGIAILEANYLGLPSIGAKNCGIEEAVNNEYSGFLVNNNKPEEILYSIDKILQDYKEFSNNARKWSASFTWDKVIHRYIKIIQK